MTDLHADEVIEAKKLGPFLATVLCAGNMIGSGIFLLPATLGAIGSISLLGWFASTAGALLLALVFSWLANLRPDGKGMVAYTQEALGRYFGFQAGVAYWVSVLIGNIAIAVAVTGYLAAFFPGLKQPLLAAFATSGALWLLTLANIVGPRLVGKYGALTLGVGLIPILVVAMFGWFWFDPEVFRASWNVSGKSEIVAVGSSLALIFWAFTGVESATVAAAVVRNPKRNIPIAAVGGVLLAALVYILATAAINGILSATVAAASSAPFADAVTLAVGAGVGGIVTVCALLKVTGTLGGWILVTSETGRASAAQGDFPAWMARTRADGVPVVNLVFLGVLMTVIVFLTQSPTIGQQFGVLINMSVVLTVLVYGYSCIALLKFSGELPAGAGRLAAQVCALAALGFCVWLIWTSDFGLLLVAAGIVAATLPLWGMVWLARRRRTARIT